MIIAPNGFKNSVKAFADCRMDIHQKIYVLCHREFEVYAVCILKQVYAWVKI
jgi:tRNA(Leu) C34 or U34 (ribose-2'-O)-methylase TrmL